MFGADEWIYASDSSGVVMRNLVGVSRGALVVVSKDFTRTVAVFCVFVSGVVPLYFYVGSTEGLGGLPDTGLGKRELGIVVALPREELGSCRGLR